MEALFTSLHISDMHDVNIDEVSRRATLPRATIPVCGWLNGSTLSAPLLHQVVRDMAGGIVRVEMSSKIVV